MLSHSQAEHCIRLPKTIPWSLGLRAPLNLKKILTTWTFIFSGLCRMAQKGRRRHITRCPKVLVPFLLTPFFLVGRFGSPTKIEVLKKVGTLVLTSLLDLDQLDETQKETVDSAFCGRGTRVKKVPSIPCPQTSRPGVWRKGASGKGMGMGSLAARGLHIGGHLG